MKLIKSKNLLKKICLILIFISLIMGINLVYAYGNTNKEEAAVGTEVKIAVIDQMFYLKERPIHAITIDKITKEVVEAKIYDMSGAEPKLFAEVRKDEDGGEMWVLNNHPNMWKVGQKHKFKAVASSPTGKAGAIEYEDKEFESPIIIPGFGSQLFENIEMERKKPGTTEPPTNKPGGGDGEGGGSTEEPPTEITSAQPPTTDPGETNPPKPDPGPDTGEPDTGEPDTEGPDPGPEDPVGPGNPGGPVGPGNQGPENSGSNIPGQQKPDNGGNTGNQGNLSNIGGNNQIGNDNWGDGTITSDPEIENTTESPATDQIGEVTLEDAITKIYNKLQQTIDKSIDKIKEDLGQTIEKIKEEMPDISMISKPGFGFDNNKMFSLLLMLIVLLPAIGLALREIFKNRWAILAFFKRKKILLIVGEDILSAEDIAESFLENVTKIEIEKDIFIFKGIYEGKKVSVMNSEDMESITETDYHELHKKYNVKNIARLERDIEVSSGEFELFDLILINKDWNNGKQKSSEEVDKFIEKLTERLNESLINLIDEDIDISEENNLVSIEMEVIDLVTKDKNSDYNIAFLLKIARSLLTEENREILAEDMIEIILDLVSEFR